ncbi:Uncharacterised protein [Halioglobus japonicus]|nr:Uncharacterised protein [Halioglobus japonicus]
MGGDLTSIFDKARLHLDQENTILLGQQSGSISGLIERSATAANPHSKIVKKQQDKDNATSRMLEILDSIQAGIERLTKDIERLEAGFRERHGEEWREKLALKILGEDDIPQRLEGESMDDYRERLEALLIVEMLNDDGSIKEEYRDDPELRDYAQWAQKQYHLKSARAAVSELEDPDTTPQRREEIWDEFRQRSSVEELTFADREAKPESDIQGEIKDAADKNRDATLTDKSDLSQRSSLFTPVGMK